MRGKSEREDTGEGMLSSGFQLRTTGSLSQARQANHPLQSVLPAAQTFCLDGWRPRGGPIIIVASIGASQYFLTSILLSSCASDLCTLPVGLSI